LEQSEGTISRDLLFRSSDVLTPRPGHLADEEEYLTIQEDKNEQSRSAPTAKEDK